MIQGFARLGLISMAVPAVAVAIFSLRFLGAPFDVWFQIDPGIRQVVVDHPVRALTHMLVAPVALFLGPFQFFPGLRARYPRAHRVSGRFYVAACVIAGAGGFATALHASGGPIAGWGFGILAVLWVGITLWAWRAAVRRDIALHRVLMRFSYALTFGAVTLRLQIPIGLALGAPDYPAMSVWLAYTSWIPNLIVVALYSLARTKPRSALA